MRYALFVLVLMLAAGSGLFANSGAGNYKNSAITGFHNIYTAGYYENVSRISNISDPLLSVDKSLFLVEVVDDDDFNDYSLRRQKLVGNSILYNHACCYLTIQSYRATLADGKLSVQKNLFLNPLRI
jgi:hypothetical protein